GGGERGGVSRRGLAPGRKGLVGRADPRRACAAPQRNWREIRRPAAPRGLPLLREVALAQARGGHRHHGAERSLAANLHPQWRAAARGERGRIVVARPRDLPTWRTYRPAGLVEAQGRRRG